MFISRIPGEPSVSLCGKKYFSLHIFIFYNEIIACQCT